MNIQTDRALVPAGASVVRYLVIRVSAPVRDAPDKRPAVHVALVLDRSGSMGGSKLTLAKKAVLHAITLLNERDRLAVIAYDNEVDTLLGATPASAEAKALATSRLKPIDARGSTDLCGGWLRGAQELEIASPGPDSDTVRRVMVLSDGLANQGETDRLTMAEHARSLRAKGITTSTFGLGADFDEELMSSLSTNGGGHFYFIETPVQIADFFTSEIGEAFDVVARDARVVLTGVGDGDVTCLNQFPTEVTGEGVSVRLGDLVSEQQMTVVLGVRCGARQAGEQVSVTVGLADRDKALFTEPMPIDWQVVEPEENAAQPVSTEVLTEVAKLLAEAARTRALNANRRGDYGRAVEIVTAAAANIRELAPGMAQLDAIADDVLAERSVFQEAMAAAEIKARHFTSTNIMHSRSMIGRAVKRDSSS